MFMSTTRSFLYYATTTYRNYVTNEHLAVALGAHDVAYWRPNRKRWVTGNGEWVTIV
jgi:hypothetical protein